MKKLLIFSFSLLILLSTVSDGWAWLVYHKPEFRGRVIDAETKELIEGAVVVVVYYKWRIIGHLGGGNVKPLDARETLTDSRGEFYFPSYTAFTPGSREFYASFIIYKPGFMYFSSPYFRTKELEGVNMEDFFAIDVIGKKGQIDAGSYGSWKGILGVVELKRGEGMAPSPDFREKLPLLNKAINEDRIRRGLEVR
jgi:hypothetical protein